MKKVLLTYGYHQSGHYSAVRALQEELESRGVSTEVHNLWQGKATTIDNLFAIFKTFAAKRVTKVPDFLIAPELLELFTQEMPFDLDLHSYEGVISTHHYSSSLVAAHKIKQKCSLPLIHVHTDYTPFPLQTHPLINFYTGATPSVDTEIAVHQKLVATGIPVRKAFHNDGTPKERKMIIMGGADGFGELERMTEFARQLDPTYELLIICGRNQQVYERLQRHSSPFQIVGFVDDVSPYLKRAEFVLTKASGLTVTEAINSGCIPLFAPPILSWEDEAARYLCAQGVGICIPEFDAVSISAVNALLQSADYKNALRERCHQMARPTAAKDIVDLLEGERRGSIALPNMQQQMTDEMRRYHQEFASAQDLPKIAGYVRAQIDEWLKKHEPDNRN